MLATEWRRTEPTSGQATTLFVPPNWKGDGTKRLVVLFHQATGSVLSAQAYPDLAKIDLLTARFGLPVLASNQNGSVGTLNSTWANDTSMVATEAQVAWAQAQLGTLNDQIVGWCQSMGATVAYQWAKRNPGKLRCLAGVVPAVGMQSVHDRAPLPLPTNMEAAWGGLAALQAAYSTHDPSRYAAQGYMFLAGVPQQLWYAEDDPVIDAAVVATYCGQAGIDCVATDVGLGGHDPGLAPAIDVATWLAAHAF